MTKRTGSESAAILVALCTLAWGAEPEAPAPVAPPPQTAPVAAAPESSRVEYEILAEYVEEDSLSPLRYLANGQVTLNDRCPVRLVRLNRGMEPVWVNGRPVGFC